MALANKDLYQLLNEIPVSPVSVNLSLERAEGSGLIKITDSESSDVQIVIFQKPSEWIEYVPPKKMIINLVKENAMLFKRYLEGAQRRNYQIIDGRIVFSYNGNPSNPDSLVLDDTYAEIKDGKLKLVTGRNLNERDRRELKDWVR